jgi:ribosomal protein L37AE/L43A
MTSGLDATPQPAGIHPDMAAHLYRLSMLLQLPDGGVRFALPDAATSRDRFVRTRWPEGVTCPECGARSIQTLPTRDIFQCRECRQQFSPTSGTALHRSRLPIQMWLLAAEAIIRWQARHHSDDGITLHVLGRLLGIHNEAASRVKRIAIHDIGANGNGLLRRAVCMKPFHLPPDIAPGSLQHYRWAFAKADYVLGRSLS